MIVENKRLCYFFQRYWNLIHNLVILEGEGRSQCPRRHRAGVCSQSVVSSEERGCLTEDPEMVLTELRIASTLIWTPRRSRRSTCLLCKPTRLWCVCHSSLNHESIPKRHCVRSHTQSMGIERAGLVFIGKEYFTIGSLCLHLNSKQMKGVDS